MTMGWNPGEGGGGGAVDSVFGRTGVVTAQSGDYASSQITDATFGDVQTMGEQLDALALTVGGKLDADSGTLTDGTLAGTQSITGTATLQSSSTLTAVSGANVTLANASSVTAPTPAQTSDDNSVVTTAFVTAKANPATYLRLTDDFVSGAIPSTLNWAAAQNGAAASVSAHPAALAGGWGFRQYTTGMTATGRAAHSFETVSGQLPWTTPWLSGTVRLEWRFRLANLPTALEDFRWSLALGTGAGVTGDDFTSGIGIRCDSANANWVLASRVLASDVATQTLTFAVAAATWTWLILDFNSTTCTAYMGTTRAGALAAGSRGSVTLVGATGVTVGPMMKLRKTVGTTAQLAYVEKFCGELAFTTPL